MEAGEDVAIGSFLAKNEKARVRKDQGFLGGKVVRERVTAERAPASLCFEIKSRLPTD